MIWHFGEADDAGAVGKVDGERAAAAAMDGEAEPFDKVVDFAVEFRGLVFDGSDDDDERAREEEGLPDGADGGDDGLAPLAGGEEQEPAGAAIEDFALDGVRMEREFFGGPEGAARRRPTVNAGRPGWWPGRRRAFRRPNGLQIAQTWLGLACFSHTINWKREVPHGQRFAGLVPLCECGERTRPAEWRLGFAGYADAGFDYFRESRIWRKH